MAGVVKRSEFLFEHEILIAGAGLDDIKSDVLSAALVNTSFSGVPLRYVVPAGSVMVYINGDAQGRVAPLFMNDGTTGMGAKVGSGVAGAYEAADIAGILSRTIELIVGDEVLGGDPPSSESDTDVSLFHHGCNFDVAKLIGYNPAVDLGSNSAYPQVNHGDDNSAIIQQKLFTCIFDPFVMRT